MSYILKYYGEEKKTDYDKKELIIYHFDNKLKIQYIQKNSLAKNTQLFLKPQSCIKVFGIKNDTMTLIYTSLDNIYQNIDKDILTLYKVNTITLPYTEKNYFSQSFINSNYWENIMDPLYLFIEQSNNKNGGQNMFQLNNFKNMIYYPYNNLFYYKDNGILKNNSNKIYIDEENYNTIIAPVQGIYNYNIRSISSTLNKTIIMPCDGYLINISYSNNNTILKFINNYYMPKYVLERDLVSVHNGNYTYAGVGVGLGNRNHPEKMLRQPNTYFVFNIIIHNTKINIKNKFYYQREILLEIPYNTYIDLTFNRQIFIKRKISKTNNTFIEQGDLIASIN